MSLQLRPARREDSPAVREMIASVLLEYGMQLADDSTDQDLQDLPYLELDTLLLFLLALIYHMQILIIHF